MMLDCWQHDPDRRPAFSALAASLESILQVKHFCLLNNLGTCNGICLDIAVLIWLHYARIGKFVAFLSYLLLNFCTFFQITGQTVSRLSADKAPYWTEFKFYPAVHWRVYSLPEYA
jgi:hypothetical protein